MTELGLPLILDADETPPPPYEPPKTIGVFGDSFTTQCVDHARIEHAWPYRLAVRLGANLVSNGVGGSGYVCMRNHSTFPYQATSAVDYTPDVLIVFGGYNDQSLSYEEVELAAAVTYRMLAERWPGVPLIVAGPQWSNTVPAGHMYTLRPLIQRAAAAVGATWVDVLHALYGRRDLICWDGLHPSDLGHERLADLLEAPARAALAA